MTSKARELANLGNAYSDGALSNRNLVINGAMQVAQRGTSFTGVTSGGYRTCDRWFFDIGSSDTGAWTVSQEADGPAGFSKSMKFECTTAKTDISSDYRYVNLQQRLEGQNVTSAKFGTSSAESLTVSFWVKSNKTGTYTVEMANENAAFRQSQEFSVSSSGTWEKKAITMSGDTAHGFASDNGISLYLIFFLAASPNLSSGSLNTSWSSVESGRVSSSNVNLADTVGNYFQITGVQLEVGDTATPFEHRSYGDELARCQRYCQVYVNPPLRGVTRSTRVNRAGMSLPVSMRAAPSFSINQTGSSNHMPFYDGNVTRFFSSLQTNYSDKTSLELDINITDTFSTNGLAACCYKSDDYASEVVLDSEL